VAGVAQPLVPKRADLDRRVLGAARVLDYAAEVALVATEAELPVCIALEVIAWKNCELAEWIQLMVVGWNARERTSEESLAPW
jgi:hypothetical protein